MSSARFSASGGSQSVSGAIVWTEENDTNAANATLAISAAAAWIEENDLNAANATLTVSVSAAIAWTEENDANASTGVVNSEQPALVLLNLNGTNGSTSIVNEGNGGDFTTHGAGTGAIQTAGALYGSGSWYSGPVGNKRYPVATFSVSLPGDFTMGADFKPSGYNGCICAIGNANTTNNAIVINRFNDVLYVQTRIGGVTTTILEDANITTMNDGNSHNATVERVNGTIRLMYDGAVVASAANTQTFVGKPALGSYENIGEWDLESLFDRFIIVKDAVKYGTYPFTVPSGDMTYAGSGGGSGGGSGSNIDTGTDPSVPVGDIYMSLNGAEVTVQAAARSVQTAAGIFHNDGRLLKTLWRRVILAANQAHSVTWNYQDEMGNTVADGAYKVKVIAHNVSYKWQGVIGNSTNPGAAGAVQQNYNMGGQTLSMPVVKNFYRAFHPISGMAFGSNGNGFSCVGFNEQQNAMFRMTAGNMNQRFGVGHDDFSRVFDIVATDGTRGYFANIGLFGTGYFYNPQNFIVAFDSNGSEITFANGSAWTEGLGPGNHWASVIDIVNDGVDAIQGLAVESSGSNLFVAHKNTGIKVFNKTTGAFIRSFSVPNPTGMALAPNGDLYVIVNGGTEFRRYTNPGSATTHNLSVTGFGNATGIGIAPSSSTVVIVDSGADQQLKAFSLSGTALWTHGVQGGHNTNGPDVTTTKFSYNDNPSSYNYVAFEPINNGDEFFWTGDPGNSRNLRFRLPSGASGSNPLVYVSQIMYITASYKAAVDKTNNNRVFSGWQEFALDYSKTITESWSLVKNWGAGLADNVRTQFAAGIQDVFTSPQSRTYAVASGVSGTKKMYELTSTGLRDTGMSIDIGTRMHEDGSLRFSREVSNQFEIVQRSFTGIDGSNNPQYGAETVVASVSRNDARSKKNPWAVGAAIEQTHPKTASGLFVTFNPNSSNTGGEDGDPALFHLGALNAGSNSDYVFRTAPAGAFTLNGNGNTGMILNGDGTFNTALMDQPGYGGSITMTKGRHVIYNYFGEFWNSGQANQWMHWLDNGLFIGQFGIANYPQHNGGDGAIVGTSGNTFSSSIIQDDGNYYVYSNDESCHGGVHRWRLAGLNSLQEMIGNIGRNTSVSNPSQIPSQAIS